MAHHAPARSTSSYTASPTATYTSCRASTPCSPAERSATYTPQPLAPVSAAPTFLAPTASTLVKSRLTDADVVGGLLPPLDTNQQSAAVSAVHRARTARTAGGRGRNKRSS